MKMSLPIDLMRKRRGFRYSDQWFRKNVNFDRISPKWAIGLNRNQWSDWTEMGDRIGPEHALKNTL